jgi:helix-turn-helix protein
MDAPLEPLLTSLDVSAWLLMPPRRVERLARQGLIPAVRLPDGSLAFERAELERWLAGLRSPLETSHA